MTESHFPKQFRWTKVYAWDCTGNDLGRCKLHVQSCALCMLVYCNSMRTNIVQTFTAGPSKNCCLGLVRNPKLCKLRKNNPKIPPKVSYLPFSHCLPPHWHFYAQNVPAYGQLQEGPQVLWTSLRVVSFPHLDLSAVRIKPATIVTNKGQTSSWRHLSTLALQLLYS